MRQPEKVKAVGSSVRACLSAGNVPVALSVSVAFSTMAKYARIQACSLTILEKANRSQGRDAKPRADMFSR